MKIRFTIYSSLFDKWLNESELYRKAIYQNVLIDTNEYENELILAKLTPELIDPIIRNHIEDISPKDYDDKLMPFEGGLRIESRSEIIESQCCGDINDYKNWEKLMVKEISSWQDIWIGHPWIFYKFDQHSIFFSEYYDNAIDIDKIKIKLTLQKEKFKEALADELDNIKDFKIKLGRVIDQGNFENKETLKRTLIE
jgi:hypothetical protein